MKKRSVSMLGVATALLVLLGSCVSPLTSLTQGTSSLPALGAKDVRLVFNTSALTPALNKSAEGATYLTVTLESVADGTVKFASATGASGVYTVTVGGMVGGEWKIRARFWDDNVNKALMFYGNTKEIIVPGQAKAVNLVVYPVGSIGSVSVSDALMPTHVTLLGQDGLPSTASDKKLGIGSSWALDGIAYYSGDDSTPASNPAVQWSSSNENVAVVSASGKVSILALGTTVIKATSSIDPSVFEVYRIEGVSPVYGSWKFTFNDYEYDSQTQTQVLRGWMSQVYRYDNTAFTSYMWTSDGEAQAIRGSYTVNGGLLTMSPNQKLDITLNPPQWVPYTDLYGDWVATIEVKGDVFLMSPIDTSGPRSLVARTSRQSVDMTPTMLLYRAPEKAVSIVTVGGQSSAFALYQGTALYSLGVVTAPVDAAVGGVIWKSDDETVLGPIVAGSNNLVAKLPGSVTLSAYALDDDFASPTVLQTLTANVTSNSAPSVSMTSSAYTKNAMPTLGFDVSDSSGLAQITWKIKEMMYGDLVASGSVTGVSGTSLSFTTDTSGNTLTDGHYQVDVTAVDLQGLGTGVAQSFDFWVDTTPPEISSTNFDNAEVQTGLLNTMTIAFADGLSGIAPGSFSVVGAQVTLNLYNSGTTFYDTLYPGVTFQSLTGNDGSFQLDLSVPGYENATYPYGDGSIDVVIADNAGNMTTLKRNFYVGNLP